MIRRFLSLVGALTLATALPAQPTAPTVAVLPFLTTARSAHAGVTAQALVGEAVQGFRTSGRFSSVLDRSVDQALRAELTAAQQDIRFDSPVKLSTSSQLNAKYLAVGLIEEQVTRSEVRDGKSRWAAEVVLQLKLTDVESGSLAYLSRVRVSSSPTRQMITTLEVEKKSCKGIRCRAGELGGAILGRAKDRAADIGLGTLNTLTGDLLTDTTEAEALRSATKNAGAIFRQFAEQAIQGSEPVAAAPAPKGSAAGTNAGAGPKIVDWEKSGGATVLVLGGTVTGLKPGLRFKVREARPGKADPSSVYNAEIGEIEVTEVQEDNARAKILSGEKEINGSLAKKASGVTIIPKR
jgi:hypothetical protein